MAGAFAGPATFHLGAAAVVLLAQLAQSGADAWVVERGRVGPVVLGASAHDVYQQFRDRVKLVDLRLEGMLSPALELKRFSQHAAPSVIAELAVLRNQLVIYRIQVADATIRTSTGIGIGSTFAELRAVHAVDHIVAGQQGSLTVCHGPLALGLVPCLVPCALSPEPCAVGHEPSAISREP